MHCLVHCLSLNSLSIIKGYSLYLSTLSNKMCFFFEVLIKLLIRAFLTAFTPVDEKDKKKKKKITKAVDPFDSTFESSYDTSQSDCVIW